MKFLVMAPMPVELRAVEKAGRLKRTEVGGLQASTGRVGDAEVVAVLAGIGIEQATTRTTRAVEVVGPDHVVVSGISGGLDPSMAIGDLQLPLVAVHGGTGERYEASPLGAVGLRGAIRTSDELLSPAQLRAFVDGELLAVDMETAAIAAVCVAAGLPWTAFRAVSDLVADGVVGDDVLALTNPDGSVRVGAGMAYVLRRPHHLPRLARLARGGNLAARVAAEAAVAAMGAPAG